nr:transposase, MuDR, MULE transposase domain protein [Tanacetum cinerariifolium]
MVMKKFNFEAIYSLNLSAKVSSIDNNFDIIDDHEEALDVAIRLKALDEGYQFLNDTSAPERHAAIALAVQDEFPLAYHVVCCRHLMMNLSLKRDKTKALFWRICKEAASVKVSKDLSSNGARVVLSTSQTHRKISRRFTTLYYTLPPNNALSGLKQIKNDHDTNVMYDIARVAGKIQLFVSHHEIDLSTVLIPNDGSLEEALE